MDGNKQLHNPAPPRSKSRISKCGTRWPRKSFNRTVRLGDALTKLIDNQISPRQARFDSVARLWSQLLPPGLYQHCKLDDVSGGQLKVLVDSPSYMHELRLCAPELLEEIQQHCPKARIKEIKFAIG